VKTVKAGFTPGGHRVGPDGARIRHILAPRSGIIRKSNGNEKGPGQGLFTDFEILEVPESEVPAINLLAEQAGFEPAEGY
jgi:hypothetical protein